MNRLVFALAMMAVVFGISRCARIKPEETRFHAILVAEINRINEEENPLCADLYPVQAFPYLARIKSRGYDDSQSAAPLPEDPLRVKWKDMVAAGLVTESAKIDLDLKPAGYSYELTSKGRGIYSPQVLPSGQKRARFCIGKPVLRQISAISKPAYSIEGLNVTAKYTLKVEGGSPALYDGTAQALGLKVPARSASGEILFQDIVATFVLQRDTGKVLSWQAM
ncbi:MAG: hypothetical protein PSX71_12175 [bacterium]|nr:hypothetical protein [bacterium]